MIKRKDVYMDYSNYEIYDFDHVSAFNMSTGFKERSYQSHWHSLVIQFSNAFINSLFDLRRIMHMYRNLHIICVKTHPELNDDVQYGLSDDVMRRMMSVTDYIKNNLTADDLSQSAMAEMAGISREYFSRIFKNITGMNYSKWLNTIRLEKAAELLAEEGRTLTEVAMLSGFQSIPSFNRVFREEKGLAPGEYRKLFVRDHK